RVGPHAGVARPQLALLGDGEPARLLPVGWFGRDQDDLALPLAVAVEVSVGISDRPFAQLLAGPGRLRLILGLAGQERQADPLTVLVAVPVQIFADPDHAAVMVGYHLAL